jgi:hypothetical protein
MKSKKSKVGLTRKQSEKYVNHIEDLSSLAQTIATQWKRSSPSERLNLSLVITMVHGALAAMA